MLFIRHIYIYFLSIKIAPVQKPIGIDPQELLRERENRINQKIVSRIEELENTPVSSNEDSRIKAIIELKALRLLNLQKQVSCIKISIKSMLFVD